MRPFVLGLLCTHGVDAFALEPKAAETVATESSEPETRVDVAPSESVASDAAAFPRYHIFATGDAFRTSLSGAKAGIRGTLGFDAFVSLTNPTEHLRPWSVGVSASGWNLSGGQTGGQSGGQSGGKIQRGDLVARLGYWFLDHRLGLIARWGSSTTTAENGFTQRSSGWGLYGLEAQYRAALSERFVLVFTAGWTHYPSAQIERDTGKLTTTNEFSNALCAIFTFGLAENCGTEKETLSIPSFSTPHLGLGLGYRF